MVNVSVAMANELIAIVQYEPDTATLTVDPVVPVVYDPST